MESPTLKRLNEQRRDALRDLLEQCTSPQQKQFDRMYKSINDIPDSKIDRAIQQCEVTIEKNKK